MRIALTGGIACGKSLVAKFFNELGVQTLDADDVVHELEAPGGAAVPAIVARFGTDVLAPGGGIDRMRLAEMVFPAGGGSGSARDTGTTGTSKTSGTERCAEGGPRRDLEAILHPLVRQRLLAFASGTPPPDIQHPTSGCTPSTPHPLNISTPQPLNLKLSVIPLLFESHFESDYDIILCVSSAEDRQVDRMMRTRGYTREQAEARLAAQMPVAEKAALADWTIHNDSTREKLKAEVQRCAAWLAGRMEKAT